MTMKSSEVVRLAKLCLPQLTDSDVSNITSSDLNVKSLCRLWAGMGHLYLVTHTNQNPSSFVIKYITPPALAKQSFGDRRKAISYDVEANFYENLAQDLVNSHCLHLPTPLHVEHNENHKGRQIIICMSYIEDKPKRLRDKEYIQAVLEWLATLHASYWGMADEIVKKVGLQPMGSYWHLATRPDEHANMPNQGWEGRLKRAARALDSRLQRDKMQCLIHGDAKDANVMVTADNRVAMCDFQYCGKGPPTKDLAYFFCSSVEESDEKDALSFYLKELDARLPEHAERPSLEELEESLELAYSDFYRFMSGWGYWGRNMEYRVKALLDRLDGGKDLGSEEAYEIAVMRKFG